MTRTIQTELERCAEVVRKALADHAHRWQDAANCMELRAEELRGYRRTWEQEHGYLQAILHAISNIQADNVHIG